MIAKHVQPKSDYLKYYRVILRYAMIKYSLTEEQLDILMYMHSDKYCTHAELAMFLGVQKTMSASIEDLLERGFIDLHRKTPTTKSRSKKNRVYRTNRKGSALCISFYKKLEGQDIPVVPTLNPIFRKSVNKREKVYQDMILKMNQIYQDRRKGIIHDDVDFMPSL